MFTKSIIKVSNIALYLLKACLVVNVLALTLLTTFVNRLELVEHYMLLQMGVIP